MAKNKGERKKSKEEPKLEGDIPGSLDQIKTFPTFLGSPEIPIVEPFGTGFDYVDIGNINKIGFGKNIVIDQSNNIADFWFTSGEKIKLEREILELKEHLKELRIEHEKEASDKSKIQSEYRQLQDKLNSKERINHILYRVADEVMPILLENPGLQKKFEDKQSCDAVVVSIDIRRSTELMLKARKPELFSKFITELSGKLSHIIRANFGIFDKFTGDGILAFFPKFYSGESAIIRAVKAATECHMAFQAHYNASRDCFNVFIKDIGLGIGVDFGKVTLVNTSSELTVVGIPVVYACRLSGAKSGETLLNQPAKEEISLRADKFISFSETELEIKNEGIALAYKVEIHPKMFELDMPEWLLELKKKEIQTTKKVRPKVKAK